ncbi:MAG: hypothetical protein KF773_17460 [Deltaproteobacteria bacterium]|nr:hypothetical protein [Deltaproteobacteria bacterium]
MSRTRTSSRLLDGGAVSTASILALDTAGRLDREIATITGYLEGREVSSTLMRSIENVVAIERLLRRRMLDAMCRTEDDVHDGIRARANIVMRALRVFREHEHEFPAAALIVPFLRLHDLSVFLTNRTAEICARWTEQSGPEQAHDPSTRHALRYLADDEAEISFARIGRNAAVATFLCIGIDRGSDAVRTACREIAVVVGLASAARDVERSQPSGLECTS